MVEDPVEPGRLGAPVPLPGSASDSSSESSSQPTSSSVEAAVDDVSIGYECEAYPAFYPPLSKSLRRASAVSMPCLRK